MERQFDDFLRAEANNPAFAASLHHRDDVDQQSQGVLDQNICAEDQTVVSEVTMETSQDLFRGPLYHSAGSVRSSGVSVSKLFRDLPRKSHHSSLLPPPQAFIQDTKGGEDLKKSRIRHPSTSRENQSSSRQSTSDGTSSYKAMLADPNAVNANSAHSKGKVSAGGQGPLASQDNSLTRIPTGKLTPGMEDESSSTLLGDSSRSNLFPEGTRLEDKLAGQSAPAPQSLRPQSTEPQYDNRGRVLKSSFLRNYSGPSPGAYASRNLPVNHVPHPPNLNETQPTNRNDGEPATGNGAAGAAANEEGNDNTNVLDAPVEKAKPNTRKQWFQKPLCWMASALFILTAVSAVIAVVLLRTKSSDAGATEEPAPPVIEKGGIDLTLVPNMTDATMMAIVEDKFSPQARAYDWISKDPNWSSYEDWRKQQRFAMVCFFETVVIINAMREYFQPSYYRHECEWRRGFDSCKGNDDGHLTQLWVGSDGNDDPVVRGAIPPELSFLPHLDTIDLSFLSVRSMEELLPLDTLSSLPPIKALNLQGSYLEGTIQSTLGLLTSLTFLNLGSNFLSGTIPKEIGELPYLTHFNIEGNPAVEAFVPSGFCSENHVSFDTLLTDWCSNQTECCPLS